MSELGLSDDELRRHNEFAALLYRHMSSEPFLESLRAVARSGPGGEAVDFDFNKFRRLLKDDSLEGLPGGDSPLDLVLRVVFVLLMRSRIELC